MRCIVEISRVGQTARGNYLLRLMRHTSTVRDHRSEFLQDENALSNRITHLGLSASRLGMTLSNLRDEDQVVWFDCEVRDRAFAEFGKQATGTSA